MTIENKSPRTMRIMGSKIIAEIPWAMIAPHEAQAISNHGQTLARLSQRGGLAACEALDIIEGRPWGRAVPCFENEEYLVRLVANWKSKNDIQS